MKKLLALAVFLVVACTPNKYAPPPPQKYQGNNIVVINFVDMDKVDATCRSIGSTAVEPAGEITGCDKNGVIVFPNPCQWPNDSDLKQLLCHELGHANGWPANHPAS